jgi:Uma2 family endonuclease
MSVDEFLNWDSGDAVRYELVDGEPRAMAPASRTHGTLQGRLATLINNHLDRENRPCSLVVEPGVVPHLLSDYNMRVPDLAVTYALYQTEEAAVLTDPILLIEILSPSNQAKTWTNIWAYASIPSVQEILVFWADRIGAELLRRSPQGEWPARPVAVSGELMLESIGFRTNLTELYRGTRLTS